VILHFDPIGLVFLLWRGISKECGFFDAFSATSQNHYLEKHCSSALLISVLIFLLQMEVEKK